MPYLILLLSFTHLAVFCLGWLANRGDRRVYRGRAHESQFLNTRRHIV